LLETLLGFKALIFAILLGGAYLIWRRGYKKRLEGRDRGADACGPCGDRDGDCRREPPDPEGRES